MHHSWVVLTARRVEAQLHCRRSGGAGLLLATGKGSEDTVLTHGAFALIFMMCRHFLGGQGDSPAYLGGLRAPLNAVPSSPSIEPWRVRPAAVP